MRRLISFSLYGDDPKYCQGAIENIHLARMHYPGWDVVFHVKDSPADTFDRLRELGARVIECDFLNMMLARFLPCCRPGIVLSRDCDSRIGAREARAVAEWLESDKPRHVIRDHKEHLSVAHPVMGGLWASREPLEAADGLRQALDDPHYIPWGSDQRWLRENVWKSDEFWVSQYNLTPWMRDSHDANYCGKSFDVIPQSDCVAVFEGFFNRLNGLVNGVLTYGKFHVKWSVNSHLPHAFEDIFRVSEGIEVVNEKTVHRFKRNTNPQKGPLCHYYLNPSRDVSRHQVEDAYRKIIGFLGMREPDEPAPLGILYRGLHPSSVPAGEFCEWCIQQARELGANYCFILSDSRRDEIERILRDGGMEVVWGKSPPMRHDLDRSDLESLRQFIADGLALCQCPVILTSTAKSTITDPARAFGREVRAYSGRRSPDCWFHRQPGIPRQDSPPLSTVFDQVRAQRDAMKAVNDRQHLYGTHLEVLKDILETMNPTGQDVVLEVGGGHFSTPLLIASGARVVTLEQGQHVPMAVNNAWRKSLDEAYGKFANWSLRYCPGAVAWRKVGLPGRIVFCFVDGNSDCRKAVVENMLDRRVPVIAAHDSECLNRRYASISRREGYQVFDFRGHEVWTRVWSRDPGVVRMMETNPSYIPIP